MKQRFTLLSILFLALFSLGNLSVSAQEINITDFTLKNHDGTEISLSQYKDKAAIAVIFTGNHCVYSKKYEERLVEMGNAYADKNIQFLLINSNDPKANQEETLELNAARAKEKAFPFPYLQDADHVVADNFGAEKQPEVFVVVPIEGEKELGFSLVYSGKIDDNPLMAEKVKTHFLIQALDKALEGSQEPSEFTDPSGCNIRY